MIGLEHGRVPLFTREPHPILRPFVESMWVSNHPRFPRAIAGARERVLPTGAMHLVFRGTERPLRIFESVDPEVDPHGRTVACSVIGGARATYYVKDAADAAWTVGAQLKPGAAYALFGVSAAELAGRHTPLEQCWGSAAEIARERLFHHAHHAHVAHDADADAGEGEPSPGRQLAHLERILGERLRPERATRPALVNALAVLHETFDVRAAVASSGYSHRRFIELFRECTGLAPKVHCRTLRFRRMLARFAGEPRRAAIDLAYAAGYSDQSHFVREFREFTGITPTEYRRAAPRFAFHVPVDGTAIDAIARGQIRSRS